MGMLEPLGQSQVLPYLEGLAAAGYEIEILSLERQGASPDALRSLGERLRERNVIYSPMFRSPSHKLPVKVWESGVAVARGLAGALRRRPDVVHARSHLPLAVADVIATLSPGTKLLFDCRGMLGDEYVDAGYWTRDRVEYKLLKAFERRGFRRAEGLVVLTHALERFLRDNGLIGAGTRTSVIPCCVDLQRFAPDGAARARIRAELGLASKIVVVYSGSLGGWYLQEAMAQFAGAMRKRSPQVVFLVLSHFDAGRIKSAARAAGLADEEIVVRAVPPAEMPAYLSAGDIGLSLIEPCFSKMGSSPTKVAEYLAAGLPVVVNAGVGDQSELAEEKQACVVLDGVEDDQIARGVEPALALASKPFEERSQATIAVATKRFSLEAVGVPRYVELYDALTEGKR